MIGAGTPPSKLRFLACFWVALSLSIGWGIRGNFGHEYGAMIPGVLGSLAAILFSGRVDWHGRAVFFAVFGALGWSFGGSISYMQVIGYTHSGHSGSVLYGFSCLFVIGFLWAALGGAGAALPAFLSRGRLTEFFLPLTAIFAAWTLQDFVVPQWFPENPAFRQNSPLYWYDTDWVAALLAVIAVVLLALARRRLDFASSLILHMAVGWWVAFLLLVNVLGWRMTPPRGDSWSGCVGMVIGMWIFFKRHDLPGLTFASVVTGLIGGFGFATADALKLAGLTTGWNTNWHSLLEQSYGFINGLGLAVALFLVARRAPRVSDDPPLRKWTEPYGAAFVLIGITYLNLSKNPEEWVKAKSMPPVLYGLSPQTWFNLAYLALAVAFLVVTLLHRRRPLAILPSSGLGRGQLLYLCFLWCVVIGNFERALVSFAPVRLVTEGVIFLNAVLCTVGLLGGVPSAMPPIGIVESPPIFPRLLRQTVIIGLVGFALSTLCDWGLARGIYGDRGAPGAARHIRFGPNATASKQKPAAGSPHP